MVCASMMFTPAARGRSCDPLDMRNSRHYDDDRHQLMMTDIIKRQGGLPRFSIASGDAAGAVLPMLP